jgi:alpha-tubulin suppressor-like RCC1 family protein
LSFLGTVKCWGFNGQGQLGLDDAEIRGDEPDEMGKNLPEVALGTARHATSMTARFNNVCALLDDESLKCWGSNHRGQLGLGDTASRGNEPGEMGNDLPVISLGANRRATSVASGAFHTCAGLDDGTAKCWGANVFTYYSLRDPGDRGDEPGEMGDDLESVSFGLRRVDRVVASNSSMCALLDDGSVKCWGSNEMGQLGLGDQANRGDQPGEVGDNLPSVSLGTGRHVIRLAPGNFHFCALLDDGSVKCWGSNENGQLGLGDVDLRGDEPDDMGDRLPAVDLGRPASSVACGGDFSCALLDDGSVKCWGGNLYGRLGIGDQENRGDEPGEMGEELPTLNLGAGRSVRSLAAGLDHTCALLDDGSIKCWGQNHTGQLGLGDRESRGDEPGEMGDNLPTVELGF